MREVEEPQFASVKFVHEDKGTDVDTSAVLEGIAKGLPDVRFAEDLHNLSPDLAVQLLIFLFAASEEALKFRRVNDPEDFFGGAVGHTRASAATLASPRRKRIHAPSLGRDPD